jgi:CubicO group peptidase (beta-lactamase class C family)
VVDKWRTRAGAAAGFAHLYVRALDLVEFLRMLRDDGRASDGTAMLSPESIALMRTPVTDIPDRVREVACGLGLMMSDWGDLRAFGHEGNVVGFSSFCRIVPELDLVLVMLTNHLFGHTLFDPLERALVGELYGVRLPEAPKPSDDPVEVDLAAFVGAYERTGIRFDIRREDDHLTASVSGPLAPALPEALPLRQGPDGRTFFGEIPILPTAVPLGFSGFDGEGRPRFVTVGQRASKRVT